MLRRRRCGASAGPGDVARGPVTQSVRCYRKAPNQGGRAAHVTATPRAIELTEIAALAAADKLAQDIVAYDVSDQLAITDAFLLCSGANDRQVRSIIDEVELRMRQAGATLVRREGEREGRWVLLDYLDVVVHVQNKEERLFYALERIWKDCPTIPLPEAAAAGQVGAGKSGESR
jgi:ribosome-associated protein